MSSTRTVVLSATGLLAVAAAAVIGSHVGTEQADRQAASTSTSSAVASPSAGTGSSRGTAPQPTPHGAQSPTSTPSSVPPTGAGAGMEVLPTPAGEPTASSYSLPPITTTKTTGPSPLMTDVPQPAAAKGRLVAGFPTALAPPAGTGVESSSLAVDGDMVEAGLVAAGGDPQAIVAHYRDVLTARGYVEEKTQGVENAPAAAFRRGKSSVTVTTGDGKTYLIAHLRATGAAH